MLESWLSFAIVLVVAVVSAVLVAVIVSFVVGRIARRQEWPKGLITRTRKPFRVLLLIAAIWIAITIAFPDRDWIPLLDHALTIACIAVGAWLLASFVLFFTDLTLGRNPIDMRDNRVARRIRTQVLITRRLAVALIVLIAIGGILLTFPGVQALGASLLASAGIVSIVAGLAAQSVLGNIFAGVQLVFSNALRVDDVVVVEGEWGRIGEITLTYVVVNIWDDRRLVLPCTYFTTQPFENWTREGSELLGAVEFDLDWRVSPGRMREQLERVLAETDLWDGRTSVLQVTEATGGLVRVRVLVTAIDAPTLFDLRCLVREELVAWVQEESPGALPVQRILMTDPDADASAEQASTPRRARGAATGSGLFTGSAEAEERANLFTQSIPVVRGDADAGADAREGDGAPLEGAPTDTTESRQR